MPYMLNLQNLLRGWADALLAWLGVTPVHNDAWDRWVAFLLVVFVAVLFDFLCRWLLLRGVRHVVRRTAVTWDDELFSDAVLGRGCHVVSALLLLIVLPVIFDAQSEAHTVVMRLMQADVERLTGSRPSAGAVQEALSNVVGHRLDASSWLFDYRTDLTDALGEAVGVDLTRRVASRGRVRDIMASVRKPRS